MCVRARVSAWMRERERERKKERDEGGREREMFVAWRVRAGGTKRGSRQT